jgi:hypothetical protein
MGEFHVADVQAYVALSRTSDCDQAGTRHADRDKQLDPLFDQILTWRVALRTMREESTSHILRGA